MALAMDLGRVYIMNKTAERQRQWQYHSTFCKTKSLECYYEPLTHCSMSDAISAEAIPHYGDEALYSNPKLSSESKSISIRFMTVKDYYVPKTLMHIVNCSRVKPNLRYYWWRALSASYYFRPNQAVVDFMKKNQPSICQGIGSVCTSDTAIKELRCL